MPDYGPSLKAARLYERTSGRGNVYLAGRWGALKVAVVKTKEVSETGEPIWQLLLSEVPRSEGRPERAAACGVSENAGTKWQQPTAPVAGSREALDREHRQNSLDDSILF